MKSNVAFTHPSSASSADVRPHTRFPFAKWVRLGVMPAVLYLFCYFTIYFPLLSVFSSRFYCDQGDGMQNVFNLWWVNKAVTELHQSPWHTSFLHFPEGTTLLGQTLNPFNGFCYILLAHLLTIVQSYNTMVVFSFVVGGVTAFLLCYDVSKSYAGSLVGGFAFTFSSFHCVHAVGHMQLVSLEWMPLFLLLWRRLLMQPSTALALGSSAALFAVILCDYYYFLYCVIVACLMVIWQSWQQRDVMLIVRKPHLLHMSTFLAGTILTSGLLVFSLLHLNRTDPLIGSHDAVKYSADLLSPFVPGGGWRFGHLTRFIWSRWTGNPSESSMYLGLSVLIFAGYAWVCRRQTAAQEMNFWGLVALIFLLLCLGPTLHVNGNLYPHPLRLRMPYHVLERVFPVLSLSGVPGRMIVITTLALAVLAASGFGLMWKTPGPGKVLAGALLVLMVVEFLPIPQPTASPQVPAYVQFLKTQPVGTVVDTLALGPGTPDFFLLPYYVSIYNKPTALGYISRTPTSVDNQDQKIVADLRNGNYKDLKQNYKLRYLIGGVPGDSRWCSEPSTPPIFRDGNVCVYDLAAMH